MKPAIRVENLSKQYRLGARKGQGYRTLREAMVEAARVPWNRLRSLTRRRNADSQGSDSIWAVKDLSFEVQPGEVVGIIGRNGSGKSTLLKILSRVTEATSGRVELRGRIGSLLEVGTGFHPELTGRENIFLNGAILGMTRREIQRKFDSIVAFADIERFLDTPVKHYSSGMYVRLAFAVATNVEPEILLIDEVLAVGDADFQRKCLRKMSEVARSGHTVLFVSHNMAAIQNLCDRTIVLANGKVKFTGATEGGVDHYMEGTGTFLKGDVDLSSHPMRRPGCLPLLIRVRLLDESGKAIGCFMSGQSLTVELTFDPAVALLEPQFGIGIDDSTGSRVFSLTTLLSTSRLPPLQDRCKVLCRVDELPLAQGRYSLSLSAGRRFDSLIDALDQAVSFDVEPADFYGNGSVPNATLGRVLVRSQWNKVD